MKIAIWGATGHVGRALFFEALSRGIECHGYVRYINKAARLLTGQPCFGFEEFESNSYDILINAVSASVAEPFSLFEIFDRFDYRLIDYARSHPECACVSISSGAAYGDVFTEPAKEMLSYELMPNRIEQHQWYGLVKLICEQRHRALAPLPIVDLRIFAFFTRYIDLAQPYFMTDVVNAILEQKPIVTPPTDFERDFIHPSDFLDLILLCAEKRVNACFDLYSLSPVKKSEILAYFQKKYGMSVENGAVWESKTGGKSRYYSEHHSASSLGYQPRFSSMDTISAEAEAILSF